MKKIFTLVTVSFVILAIAVSGCGNNGEKDNDHGDSTVVANDTIKNNEPREGDMCSVVNDSTGKTFGVIKVLKIEDDIYHIRTYGVSFEKRPQELDVKDLKATTAGIGHLPLEKQHFHNWNPEVIVNQPVTDEELEGYKLWKKH